MSFVAGLVLDTVTLGRRELKRLHYLALRGPTGVERRAVFRSGGATAHGNLARHGRRGLHRQQFRARVFRGAARSTRGLRCAPYAGNLANLRDLIDASAIVNFVHGDIRDRHSSRGLRSLRCRARDSPCRRKPRRSIDSGSSHVRRDQCHWHPELTERGAHVGAATRAAGVSFLHVSTDEVYGALSPSDPPFNETTAYAPTARTRRRRQPPTTWSAHGTTRTDCPTIITQLFEQLRAVAVSGKTDSADDPERVRGKRCPCTATDCKCATGCTSRSLRGASWCSNGQASARHTASAAGNEAHQYRNRAA